MDMDLATITAGMAAAKAGFETLRTAAGLVKDAQGLLPAGEKKDAVARTLEEADRQVRLAEAQIAQALGYPLCRCAFPPTPMLKVGHGRFPSPTPKTVALKVDADVHECPRCRQNDARQWGFTRKIAVPGGLPEPAGA